MFLTIEIGKKLIIDEVGVREMKIFWKLEEVNLIMCPFGNG